MPGIVCTRLLSLPAGAFGAIGQADAIARAYFASERSLTAKAGARHGPVPLIRLLTIGR
jgi:hypothetical protein